MIRTGVLALASLCLCLLADHGVQGRGFGGGGYRGGGGGYRGGYGGYRGGGGYSGSAARYSGNVSHGFSSFSGADRFGGSYSGARTTGAWSGVGSRGASSTYDHTWSNAAGGSLSTSGTRGVAEGRFGGAAVGGNRETTLTTAGGRTLTGERQGAAVAGPGGRTLGAASGGVEGRYGAGNWHSAFSGNRYTGDMSHYASVYGANGLHSTAYWSRGYLNTHAGYIRNGFGYYGCFNPAWYTAHPGCWAAAGWAAGAAWATPTYADISSYCDLPAAQPPNYDYGNDVVYQGDNVYMGGQPAWNVTEYAQQATDIASQGQTATAPPTDDWKALGVYALVQGDEKTSNNVFQLAINKEGVIRGNYYDGLMNTTTDVYGSVNKKAMLAAWTIGKAKDRVFEAGISNLTQPQCPCLLHVGTQTTEQMLLVRMEQPKKGT
jgi:hypothetical protein